MPRHTLPLLLGVLALGGCAAAQRFLDDAFRERPPAPRDRLLTASDARLDSLGRLSGSFTGEGTRRAVHLVSSDSMLVEAVLRMYHPGMRRTTDFWSGLKGAGVMRIPLREGKGAVASGLLVDGVRVGSPEGEAAGVVTAASVRIGRCGARGSQLELLVEPARRGGPALTGPLVAAAGAATDGLGEEYRDAPAEPDSALVRTLVARTRAAIDSALAAAHPSVRARRVADVEVVVNTLADFDAAEVAAYRAGSGRVRYAVSFRERRVAGADTLLAAGVMAWDSGGAWQQFIFRPVYLRFRAGKVAPWRRGEQYWRRVSAVADFRFDRDNLWMEQLDARDGSVLWGIVQPADNAIVAAAEMEGPCQ